MTDFNNTLYRSQAFLLSSWRWLLVLSVLPLFGGNALYNIPLGIMAVVGLYTMTRSPANSFKSPAIRLLLLAFMGLWLPQIFSLPDAVNLTESLRVSLSYIGYFFAAFFMMQALKKRDIEIVLKGILIIMSIWALDSILAWSGLETWFGHDINEKQIAGILFSKLTLGHLLAVLSPLVFEYLRQNHARPRAWLLFLAVLVAILISGKRVAWMMFIVASAGYFVFLLRFARNISLYKVCGILLLSALTITTLYFSYAPFHARVNQTAGIFSGDPVAIDKASAMRLDLWRTAWNMSRYHWINGVGPRGYRDAYADHAEPDDFWINKYQQGQTHPHQLFLEIAAETGFWGITGFVLFWWACLCLASKSSDTNLWLMLLCVAVAVFPANSHLAFYGSYWSGFIWWLCGLMYAHSHNQ